MRDRRMKQELHRLETERTRAGFRDGHRAELYGDLVSRYRDRNSRNRRWLMLLNPWNRSLRFAVLGLALMVLGVGACTTSTTTEMEMGHRVEVALTDKAAEADLMAMDADLSRYLDSLSGVDNVSVGIRETPDGQAAFDIMVWGTGLDADTLVAGLRREVPGFASAAIDAEALTGTFEESFASKLRREIFNIEVDGGTAEEIRAGIMEQLEAEGLADGAEVEVNQADGLTDIKITIEKDDAED